MCKTAVYASVRWRRALSATLFGAGLALSACEPDTQLTSIAAEQAKPIHRFDHLHAVAYDAQRMVAVGTFGVVAVSTDGGKSWTRRELPGSPDLIKVARCGDGGFVALDINDVLWMSGPEAANWTSAAIPAGDAVLDLTCTADNHVWVVGARGALLTSSDRGAHWADKSLAEDIQLLNVQFPSASSGVVTGEFGRVLVTKDGGANWAEGGSLGPDFYPQGMDFQNDRSGVVVGLSGAVLETTDGGQSWTRGKAPTEAPLYGVVAGRETLVVGAAGLGFRKQGAGWQPIAGLPLTDLRDIVVTPAGILVAGAGTLTLLPPSGAN